MQRRVAVRHARFTSSFTTGLKVLLAFTLDVRNPHIGLLEDKYKQEFEEILGAKLRVINQHM
jgi:hypothetical protein